MAQTPFFLRWTVPVGLLTLGLSCGGPQVPMLANADGTGSPIVLELGSLTGTRDGDRLRAQAALRFAQGTLDLSLLFEVGVPTRLLEGRYQMRVDGKESDGRVTATSVTFLGGQSDRPNLGANFTLFDGSQPKFRLQLPTSPVEKPGGDLPQ